MVLLDHFQTTIQTIHQRFDNGIRIYQGITEGDRTLLTHAQGSIPYVRDITAVQDNILSLYGIIKTLYRTTLTVTDITDFETFSNQNFWLSFDFGETFKTASLRKDLSRFRTTTKSYWIYLEIE